MKNFQQIATLILFPVLSALGISQTVKQVVVFSNAHTSANPVGSPAQGRNGKLYVAASGFGRSINTNGKVLGISTSGVVAALHTFTGTDGATPAGLILGTDGNYYGAAYGGGTGHGLLFKITANGAYTVLYQFTGGSDGGGPSVAPIQASDGNLYGTTAPATANDGTVYGYVPSSGAFSTILSLNLDGSQGQQITAPVLQASDGNLYGTAELGGANGCGTIFKLTTSGTLLQLYSFPCGAGGSIPYGPLIEATDGNFYGTTQWGGTVANGECQSGCGAVFKMSHGEVSILYRFSGKPDGGLALAGLVQGTDGNLYGATYKGGINDLGTLYQISSSGQYKLLYSFVGEVGYGAVTALTQDTNGKFYGNAGSGGRYGEGSLYSLDMGFGPFIALVRYTGRIGQPVQILGQGLTGSTAVTVSGVAATSFKVVSDTYMTAVVPTGATTGPVVVTTPTGTLTSNHNFRIVQ